MLNSRLLLSFLTAFLFSFSNLIFSQNNAWQFDGSTGEAQSAAAVQAVNFNRFTLETWVKMADSPADPTDALAGVGSLSQPLIWLWFDRTGVQFAPNSLVVGFFDGSAAVNFSHVFDFQPDVWTHVAASFNGNASPKTLDLYLDGVLAASFAPSSNPANWSDERTFLGKIPGTTLPGNHLDGSLDDLRIWKTNRTATQILAFKNTELVGTETNLWNYYKFSAGDCSGRDCAGENLFLKKSGGVVAAAGPALTLDVTCPPTGCAAPMSGVYTVGGASPDFASIQLAINALQARGAADSVFFHLRPVLHNQPILGKSFFGFSQNTPAIFKKEPGTSGTATVYAPTALLFRQSNNYHFENLKFTQLVKLDTCQRTSFRSCTFLNGTMAMQVGTLVDTFLVENCVFDGGSGGGAYGLDFNSLGGTNRRVSIVGNQFLRHYLNSFRSISQQEDLLIDHNFFNSYGDEYGFTPMSIANAKRKIYITNNHIRAKAANAGMSLSHCNTQTTRCLVANNFIRIDSICRYGLYSQSCERFDFYHNSVWVKSYKTPFFLKNSLPQSRVKNNIFIGRGTYIYETTPGSLDASDNNIFSVPFVAFTPAADNLEEWQNTFGFDENSLLLDPQFNTDSIPAPQNPLVNNLGATIVGIPEILTDILGDTRTSPPDAGAREFTPPPPVPMCGAYSVGGASPDFATPLDAGNALIYNGMSCPVTFNLQVDSFAGAVFLNSILKTNPADAIVFRRDPAAVSGEVFWQSNSFFVVKIENTPNVRFENLTFQSHSATMLDFRSAGGRVKNCKFMGTYNQIGIAANALADSLLVDSCRFSGGLHGISLASAAGDFLENVEVKNCIFRSTYNWSLKADGVLPNFIFQKNKIDGRGISLAAAGTSNPKILNNRFATAYGSAISIQNLAPLAGQSALVGNNFFSVKSAAAAPGLHFLNCQKIDFFHNSVATLPGSVGTVVVFSGSQNRLKNNIFSSRHNRPVLSATATALVESDYNDLHSTGATLAIFGSTNCANLAAWRTASGQDVHSVSANPDFFSSAKLLPDVSAADAAGVFLTPTVPDLAIDLYGAMRSDPPDLGALQFVPNSFGALCGEYYVGGLDGDFLDPADVQVVLSERGMGCNTTFNLWTGTPGAAMTLQNIQKAHPTDTIRFRPAAQIASLIEPILIKNTSDVFFEKIYFGATVKVENSDRATFDSCNFRLFEAGTLLRVLGDSDSLRVTECHFDVGFGNEAPTFWLSGGTAAAQTDGVLIEKSKFEDGSQTQQILLEDHFKNLKISQNSFVVPDGDYSVLVSGATGNFSIDKNRFTNVSGGGTGISIGDFVGNAAARSVISNNYTASQYLPFQVFNASHLDIFHNTIRAEGSSSSICFSSTGGSKNRFFNNIVANLWGGMPLEISNVAAFDSMNFNN